MQKAAYVLSQFLGVRRSPRREGSGVPKEEEDKHLVFSTFLPLGHLKRLFL